MKVKFTFTDDEVYWMSLFAQNNGCGYDPPCLSCFVCKFAEFIGNEAELNCAQFISRIMELYKENKTIEVEV